MREGDVSLSMKNKSGKHAHTKRNRETETGKEKDTFLDVAHDEYEQKRTEQSGRKMKGARFTGHNGHVL